jgi:RimJ/RimL family protein N-acetyltransferase
MKYLLDGHETERLLFRLFTKEDMPLLEDLYRNPLDRTFLAMPREPSTKELMELWYGYCLKRYDKDLGGENALIDKASNKLIGQCGLLVQDVHGQKQLEVSYAILPQYRNMGYATEAAKKCRDVAFESGFTETLISIIHADNQKSVNVALKNGMVLDQRTELWNIPVLIYKIEKDDWLRSK